MRSIEHWIAGSTTAVAAAAAAFESWSQTSLTERAKILFRFRQLVDDNATRLAEIIADEHGNGTAIFTSSGAAARRFQPGVHVGVIGINEPIPVPMTYYSFGGWKDSLFGDKHVHGPEGVAFYTRAKVVTARWPHVGHPGASYNM